MWAVGSAAQRRLGRPPPGSGKMAHMHPTPERIWAIRDYFELNHDRAEASEPNPLFVGRDRELKRVLHYASALDRSDRPRSNMTGLIYGAPGAGKSELLVQLKDALNATESENPPIVIDGDGDILMDAGAFADALYNAAPEPIRRHFRKRGWTLNEVSMKFGPVGLTAHREPHQSPPSGQVPSLNGIARLLREANGGLMPTVVLLIDEAQAELAKAARHPDAQYALQLHLGKTGLKALTVYGGLGNTEDALADCGVTRPGEHMNFLLKRLEADIVRDTAVEALAATTGADDNTIGAWADQIATYAQGWPAHLSSALHATITTARENGWSLDQAGFDEAMGVAGRARTKYYNDRLKRCTSLQPGQFSVWAGMFEGLASVTAATIGESLKIDAPEAGALVRKAVHAGLLEQHDPGFYIAPIPSMVAHIAALGRQHDAKAKPRGQVR